MNLEISEIFNGLFSLFVLKLGIKIVKLCLVLYVLELQTHLAHELAVFNCLCLALNILNVL